MGRLTHRKENGEAAVWLYADPEKPAEVCREQLRKEKAVLEKLAYYEDLEEAGRLLVIPKELKTEELIGVIAENACPRWVGLPDSKGTPACDHGERNCLNCWQEALRCRE